MVELIIALEFLLKTLIIATSDKSPRLRGVESPLLPSPNFTLILPVSCAAEFDRKRYKPPFYVVKLKRPFPRVLL